MASCLIIEDDHQVRKMLSLTLERAGHYVDEAVDGQEGTEMCAINSYDIIIADILTPRKEGLETILELRQEYPEMKIIAVSGGGRVGPTMYLQTAKVFGADYTFEKPIDRKKLLEKIDELLEKTDDHSVDEEE
jgi:DNA-binding response OmpR family regulator